MAPRKSTASIVSAAPTSPTGAGNISLLSPTTEPKSPTTAKPSKQPTTTDGEGEKSSEKKKASSTSKHDEMGIDDLLLPRTLTSRLSRGTLPPNTSIQRDALLALAKSATVFISYIAHTANSLTSRKTIQSQDILEALRETELWSVPLPGGGGRGMTLGEKVAAEVEKWEGEVRGKRKGYRDRVKARDSGVGGGEREVDGEVEEEEEGKGPQIKRARRSSVVDGDGDTTMDGEEVGDDDGDGPAAQLRGEDMAAANGDGTETDPELVEDEEEDDVDEEEEEVDGEEQDDGEDDEEDDGDGGMRTNGARNTDRLDMDDEDDQRRRTALAPNGRVEIGSDEESD